MGDEWFFGMLWKALLAYFVLSRAYKRSWLDFLLPEFLRYLKKTTPPLYAHEVYSLIEHAGPMQRKEVFQHLRIMGTDGELIDEFEETIVIDSVIDYLLRYKYIKSKGSFLQSRRGKDILSIAKPFDVALN